MKSLPIYSLHAAFILLCSSLLLCCLLDGRSASAAPVEIAAMKIAPGPKTIQRLYYRNSSNLNGTYSVPAPGLQDFTPQVFAYASRYGILYISD
jgi:hypothetical protein